MLLERRAGESLSFGLYKGVNGSGECFYLPPDLLIGNPLVKGLDISRGAPSVSGGCCFLDVGTCVQKKHKRELPFSEQV